MLTPCSADHDPTLPLGTVMPCGCVIRIVLPRCSACGVEEWSKTATNAEVGELVPVRGFCFTCGGLIQQLVTLYKEPIPGAFQRN
jgi:hypothetical protein